MFWTGMKHGSGWKVLTHEDLNWKMPPPPLVLMAALNINIKLKVLSHLKPKALQWYLKITVKLYQHISDTNWILKSLQMYYTDL